MSPENILSKRVLQMSESATIRMSQMARKLRSEGHDIINLSLGEPDFDTPVHIKEAAKEALDHGHTKYTAVPGHIELRQAIATKFEKENNLHYKPEEIMVSNGAKQCIANLCLALLDPMDEVIIFAPYWVSYNDIVNFVGGKPVPVYAGIESDFKINGNQLRSAITSKTKAILFSSPCNPTGSVYSEDELRELAKVIMEFDDIYVISDEIYEYINFESKHFSIGSIAGMEHRTITVNGMAKGFAMTGWRLGYMGGPKFIIDACSKVQGQFTSGASNFGQIAAQHALESSRKPTQEMAAAFKRRRDLVIEGLKKIKGLVVNFPQGAFYVFPDVSYFFGRSNGSITIKDADDFAEQVLAHAHLAIVSGSAFGDPNCIRISYAASDQSLIEAVDRLSKFLKDFR